MNTSRLSFLSAFVALFAMELSGWAGTPTATPFPAGARWVAIGDSITRGGGYHEYVMLYYATRFPDRPITLFNAGITADTTDGALRRLDWDILSNHPTVATIMMGANDVGYTLYQAEHPDAANLQERADRIALHERSMRALVDTLLAAQVDVTLIIPSILDGTAQLDKPGYPAANEAMGVLADRDRALAAEKQVGLIDFRSPMMAINTAQQQKDPSFTIIGKDRIHPGPAGHLVMAYAFLKAQGMPSIVSRVSVDARTGQVRDVLNATVSEVKRVGAGGLAFTIKAGSLPFPVPKEARAALAWIPFMDALNQELLSVPGLHEGRYRLEIDGATVGEYSAAEWAAGIQLADNERTPQYQQALEVAKLNRRRHDLGSERSAAYLGLFVLKPNGYDVEDSPEVRAFLKKFADEKQPLLGGYDHSSFAHAMALRYLEGRAENAATRERQDQLISQMYEKSIPKPHRYTIVPIR